METETLGLTTLPVGAGAGLARSDLCCVPVSFIESNLLGSRLINAEPNGGRFARNQKVFAEVHGGFRV